MSSSLLWEPWQINSWSLYSSLCKGDIFPETQCVFHTSFSDIITGILLLSERAWSKSFKWDSDWFSHFPAKYFYSNFLFSIDVHRHLTKPGMSSTTQHSTSGSKTKAEVTQGQVSSLTNLQSIFMCHSSTGLIIIKHLIFWSLNFSNISSRAN